MATTLTVAATTSTLAQSSNPVNQPHAVAADSGERQFLFDNELAMSKMSRGMMVNPTGDVDRDFVAMMIPHHQGAIDMAEAEIKYGHSETLRRLAASIVNQQGQEISIMHRAIGGPQGKIPSEANDDKQLAQGKKVTP
ncbi:DUF305 domain-containing protein [Bradyrhizobium sp. HKCCYLS1011]|uniref:DUF305 domain-containing protein n=1 Tax=Bradyrhizobium sp. HKCCYLS1011 TaxID=3420733 RepID=UPI003EBC7E2B